MEILSETALLESDGDYSPSLSADLDEAMPESSPRVHDLCVPIGVQGQRLDQVLAGLLPEHSRNRLQNWIKEGRVSVNGAVVTEPKAKAFAGQRVVLTEAGDPGMLSLQPENIPLNVVFEDEHILVINKPAGLVVHPGSGNWQGTLLNALLFHYPASQQIPRAGIVHRLDKDTSGLMVVAKTLLAQTDLVRQLQARTVKREYLALVEGEIVQGGVVNAPIGRHPTQRIKMAVVPSGKPAVTHYRILEKIGPWTRVTCALETGRTHQIRVHMAHIGHPLVGDPVYGRPERVGRKFYLPFGRQALHATRLGLIHPATEMPMHWEVAVPEDMQTLLTQARLAGSIA